MDFILDKRDATTIKVIDGRKRLVGTIQHAAGRCIVTDCRDVRTGLVLRNEIESQQYFNQFNWSNIMGRTDGDTESRVIITIIPSGKTSKVFNYNVTETKGKIP